jgi:hypothetical protein
MKYYVNGFNQSHISIKGYIPLPIEQYPEILTAKQEKEHYIIYKNPELEHIADINSGDRITHINNIKADKFYNDYLAPFYANDNSELTKTSASLYALIIDGNRFKPIAKTITISKDGKPVTIELNYQDLTGDALNLAKQMRQPGTSSSFKVEQVSKGVWIKIPGFYPTPSEKIYFTGMLSNLKHKLAKKDYVVFDLRGNRGGLLKWAHPIIRNLWGDDYLKSLKGRHDFNSNWIKKFRVSKENFIDFKRNYNFAAIKAYARSLQKKEDFFTKKWDIYKDSENLYTNNDNNPVNAKIYVLTDSFCRSTCWTFVNELKQIPGVIHLGIPTTIQSIYSYARKDLAPSKNFDFFYPTQIRIQPANNLSKELIPDNIYKGDLKDEPAITNWILSITEPNH